MVAACTSAENRADTKTKSLPVDRLRQLRQWNGLVLDRSENAVDGDMEDGQDERRATSQCLGAMCAVTDTLAEKHLLRTERDSVGNGNMACVVTAVYERTMCARWLAQSRCFDHPSRVAVMDLFLVFHVVNPTRCLWLNDQYGPPR